MPSTANQPAEADTMRIAAVVAPLRQQVVLKIREAIAQGRFSPGEGLVERELCDLLGVSRTALREAQEEVGIAPERVEILGRLPEYRTSTGFAVTPVVGWAEPPLEYRPDPHEVADVFEVPLAFLLDERNHRYESAFFKGRLRKYWAMPYGDRFIWGATAGMLVTFHRILAR